MLRRTDTNVLPEIMRLKSGFGRKSAAASAVAKWSSAQHIMYAPQRLRVILLRRRAAADGRTTRQEGDKISRCSFGRHANVASVALQNDVITRVELVDHVAGADRLVRLGSSQQPTEFGLARLQLLLFPLRLGFVRLQTRPLVVSRSLGARLAIQPTDKEASKGGTTCHTNETRAKEKRYKFQV